MDSTSANSQASPASKPLNSVLDKLKCWPRPIPARWNNLTKYKGARQWRNLVLPL